MRNTAAMMFLCSGLVLSGCSYRPLYGTSAESAGVAATLASVSIPPATDRLGQIIRNDLISGMGRGNGEERYTLLIRPVLKKTGQIDKPLPNVTRQAVHLSASFDLIERSSGTTVHSGKTFSQVSFDLVRQPFADMQAETTATERVAHEVSADIRTRLAAYFAAHPDKQ
jgi:LPS-assembly lipoprotein